MLREPGTRLSAQRMVGNRFAHVHGPDGPARRDARPSRSRVDQPRVCASARGVLREHADEGDLAAPNAPTRSDSLRGVVRGGTALANAMMMSPWSATTVAQR